MYDKRTFLTYKISFFEVFKIFRTILVGPNMTFCIYRIEFQFSVETSAVLKVLQVLLIHSLHLHVNTRNFQILASTRDPELLI